MPEINKQQAEEFLSNISKEDNVAIIHHDDGDGVCSGIILNEHCIKQGATTKTFTYHLSKTKLSELDLSAFNKIIITDVSVKAIQEDIKSIKNTQIFVTDHHPKYDLPNDVLYFPTTAEGYIQASRTAYELTGIKKWLALIGVIADSGNLYKENDNFIKETLEELNLTLEEFQKKYSHIFSDTIVYFADTPEKIFPILAEINSLHDIEKLQKYAKVIEEEIQKHVKGYKANKEKIGNINLYQFEPKFQVKGIVAAILSRGNQEETFIFFSQKDSDPNLLGISARDQSPNANLPKLLEAATKDLENSNCGGHPRASGGQIQTKDLEKFKNNLKDYIQKQP